MGTGHAPSLPTITAYPARTPDEALSAGYLIDRPGARLIVTSVNPTLAI
ncbi:hypothetical protein [Nonomuraea dietziae]